MIKANDLRIGNWVKSVNGLIQIDSIDPDCGVNQYLNTSSRTRWIAIEEIDPIPLTPEILDKVGFGFLEPSGTFAWKFAPAGVCINVKCEYLHQLQNLYFALTGEELDIYLLNSGTSSGSVDSNRTK